MHNFTKIAELLFKTTLFYRLCNNRPEQFATLFDELMTCFDASEDISFAQGFPQLQLNFYWSILESH
jgi:hypothetical protein